MLRFADDLRVNLYREPVDFRCGINTLAFPRRRLDADGPARPRRVRYGRNCAEGAARGGHASGARSGRPQPAIDCKRVSIYRRIGCSRKKRPASPSTRSVMPSLCSTATKRLAQTSFGSQGKACIECSSEALSVTNSRKSPLVTRENFGVLVSCQRVSGEGPAQSAISVIWSVGLVRRFSVNSRANPTTGLS